MSQKRIITSILTFAMVLSLTVPAFATDGSEKSNSNIEVNSSQLPTLEEKIAILNDTFEQINMSHNYAGKEVRVEVDTNALTDEAIESLYTQILSKGQEVYVNSIREQIVAGFENGSNDNLMTMAETTSSTAYLTISNGTEKVTATQYTYVNFNSGHAAEFYAVFGMNLSVSNGKITSVTSTFFDTMSMAPEISYGNVRLPFNVSSSGSSASVTANYDVTKLVFIELLPVRYTTNAVNYVTCYA